MLRVALTGGIATGKSHVLGWFKKHRVETLDADELAHGALAPGSAGAVAVRDRFGPGVFGSAGVLDRQKLGALVFADPVARRDLEAIVHPAVYRAMSAAFLAFERLGVQVAIADIPLLYETGREGEFDCVIATVCPRSLQMARLVERGLTETAAEQRLEAQMPAEEKARRADYVIQTDGTFADTDAQIEEVWRHLLARGDRC